MKIVVNKDASCKDMEIIINCREEDTRVASIVATLNSFDKKLTGHKEGKSYILEPDEVLYVDTVDRRTFIYTEKEVYETDLKLYEVEERFKSRHFFRAAKSTVVNIGKIQALAPDFGGRLELTMQNGEKLAVSRQYARELKTKLEM